MHQEYRAKHDPSKRSFEVNTWRLLTAIKLSEIVVIVLCIRSNNIQHRAPHSARVAAWLISAIGGALAAMVVAGVLAGRLGLPIAGSWLLGAGLLGAPPPLLALVRRRCVMRWAELAAALVGAAISQIVAVPTITPKDADRKARFARGRAAFAVPFVARYTALSAHGGRLAQIQPNPFLFPLRLTARGSIMQRSSPVAGRLAQLEGNFRWLALGAAAVTLALTGSFQIIPAPTTQVITPDMVAAPRWLRANAPKDAARAITVGEPAGPLRPTPSPAPRSQSGCAGKRRMRLSRRYSRSSKSSTRPGSQSPPALQRRRMVSTQPGAGDPAKAWPIGDESSYHPISRQASTGSQCAFTTSPPGAHWRRLAAWMAWRGLARL